MIGRRDFLKRAAGLAALAALGGNAFAARPSARKPNVVLINCDDMGYGDLGCYGNELIKTPNVDRMAHEGVRFTDFYSCAPVCTPSRAGLMTGRYPVRSGLTNVLFPNDKVGLSDSEITVAQLLKSRGYSTAIIGKWHLGHLPQFLPTRHGFDYYYGIPYSNDMQPTPLMRMEEKIEEPADQDTLTERYTQETTEFMRKHREEPFFIYLAHNMPHRPLHASERFRGRSKRGIYGDVVECIDWGVGEILKAINDLGLKSDTLVLFTSDNGPAINGAALKNPELAGEAGPLRGSKGSVWEGGMREPMVAHWPGRIEPGRVCREPASMLDMLPTLTAMAGGKAPTDRPIDGRDITSLLLDGKKLPDCPFFYMQGGNVNAVRCGAWKLRDMTGEPPERAQLYNLSLDIGERRNVAKDHPEVVGRLRGMIAEFKNTLPEPEKQ